MLPTEALFEGNSIQDQIFCAPVLLSCSRAEAWVGARNSGQTCTPTGEVGGEFGDLFKHLADSLNSLGRRWLKVQMKSRGDVL